jgi:hypothetical protein
MLIEGDLLAQASGLGGLLEIDHAAATRGNNDEIWLGSQYLGDVGSKISFPDLPPGLADLLDLGFELFQVVP